MTRGAPAVTALALALGCVFAGLPAPVAADATARVVKIGLDLPLSGIDGASAIPARNAVLLALEDAGRRGLPGGVKLELEDLDDTVQGKHDPAQGAQNMRTLAADPAVLAVVGPMNSNVAEAEIPVANAAGLALISMAATAVALTHAPAALRFRPEAPDRVTFFRVCATDDLQGTAIAAFARGLRLRRAFVLDDNESYGRGLADVFAAAFPRAGGAIAGREHLTPFALDFQALLTKVRATAPDSVFFGGIISTGGAVLRRQMADAGLANIPYFGGDGLAGPEYVALAGAAADGTYFTLVAPDVGHLAAAGSFVNAYRARFKSEPGSYSAGGYAAAAVVVAAVRHELAAHPDRMPSRSDVVRAIARTRDLASPAGPIGFNAQGDLLAPIISLYRIEHGVTAFVGQRAVRP